MFSKIWVTFFDIQVYSWGTGDGGRLGHGDQSSKSEVTLVKGLENLTVVHIACGSTYSAAVTTEGELYTWGKGNYGRLGHGSSDDHYKPTLVTALKGLLVLSHKMASFIFFQHVLFFFIREMNL